MWQQKIFQKIKINNYICIYIPKKKEYCDKKISFFYLYFSYIGEISHTQKTLMVDNVKVVAIIKCL
jgi:hypothetical protein